jgi:tRNA A37 threonylcarbamoyladenosine biosynthesis protein TsaE
MHQFASSLTFPFSIGFIGALGAGKTTSIRYLFEYFHVLKVSSPTFTLCHEYALVDGKTLEHWDLYRLGGVPCELYEPLPSTTGRVVEWINKFPELLHSYYFSHAVELSIVDDTSRQLEINAFP